MGTAHSLLDDLSGIVASILMDNQGSTVMATGAVDDPKLVATQIAMVVRDMDQLAATLHLGLGEVFTIEGERTRRVIGLQRGAIASIEVGAKRPITDVEHRLRGCEWASAIECPPPLAVEPSSSATALVRDRSASPTSSHVAARSPERKPVFAGDLQLFSVPDVLEFLRTGQRTGTLTFYSAVGVGVVQLRGGRITSAVSPGAAGIGDFLVEWGELAIDQVHDLIGNSDAGAPPDAVLARLLLERGLASDEKLRAALLARMHDAVRELVTWMDGRFAFDPAGPVGPLLPGLDLEIDSQPLLLNIFREQDEASRLS